MQDVSIPIVLEVKGLDTGAVRGAIEIFRDELMRACDDIGDHVAGGVKRIIIEEQIRYTSTLLESITWSLFEETATIVGVAVGTNIDYAKYVEFGTVPHFVPFHIAKTLYDQAQADWGWTPVEKTTTARLNAVKSALVRKGPGGMFTITGKHQTYLTKHPERLWLRPAPGARPVWGVTVSGEAQPFLWPGWEQSLAYCEKRLNEACERAAARLGGGAE